MRIRPATVDDAEAIAGVNAAAWKAAFRGAVSDEYLDAYDGLPELRRHDLTETAASAIQLVAEDDTQIVGWAVGDACKDADSERAFEIRACYVAPTHWRRGVGRRLVEAILKQVTDGHYKEAVVWTGRDTSTSQQFYESLGFRPDGRETILDRDGGIPMVRFNKPLDRPL